MTTHKPAYAYTIEVLRSLSQGDLVLPMGNLAFLVVHPEIDFPLIAADLRTAAPSGARRVLALLLLRRFSSKAVRMGYMLVSYRLLAFPETVSASFLVGLAAALSIFCLLLVRREQTRFPPGPGGWPLLGMGLSHPKSEYWKTYARWGREYGDKGMVSFHIFGRRIVVINSREAAEELLNHRGAIYSDRPFPTMSGLLMKREKSIFLMSYTERLKSYRKLMHHDFNVRTAQKYWPLQEHEALVLLRGLLDSPRHWTGHIRRNAGAVIMRIAFGYDVKCENDHFLALAQEGMRVASLAGAPGKWLVDYFPILRFLPGWFPGAAFKRKAAQWGRQLYDQSLEPHDYVKRQLASGKADPSFTSQHLSPDDGPPANAEVEDLILWTAGALFAGGSDTTVSAVRTFFFAMLLHPEIQRTAQAEIDEVVGSHRLPKLSDRQHLPYIDALIKETLRWGTVSPMALPHSTAVDDVVFGYRIPKGCIVIPNLWAMLHDESVYPDPFKFDPARFTDEKQQPDPRELAFGRGRRVCPGQHIAEASVFIQVASVLAAFDIQREIDDSCYSEAEAEVEFTTAIVSHVKPFKCRITPRREGVRTLVEEAMDSS